MSSPQDTLNIATTTATSVQPLAAALQQHTLQPALQTKVTLPPFWSHDPAAWFQHIEAEFIIARVLLTSYLCYLHVIRALPADVVTAVRDITTNITAESVNAYDAVKQALLKRFTTSALQRCFQLLDTLPLGDSNIAAHNSQMRSLIPADADVLFKALFLRTLPPHISTALADRAELPSAELAAAAQAAVAAATPLPPSPPPSVSAAPSQRYGRSPGRSAASRGHQATPYRRRSSSRDNPHSPARSASRRLCWYHQNFGRQTRRCDTQHCDWKTNSGSSGNSHRLSIIPDRSRRRFLFSSLSSPPHLPH
jgi:hypothetical protein